MDDITNLGIVMSVKTGDISGLQEAESTIDRVNSKANDLRTNMSNMVGSHLGPTIDDDPFSPAMPGQTVADIEGKLQLEQQQLALARERLRSSKSSEQQWQSSADDTYNQRHEYLDRRLSKIPNPTEADRKSIWDQAVERIPIISSQQPIEDPAEILKSLTGDTSQQFGDLQDSMGKGPRNKSTGKLYLTHQRKYEREITETLDSVIDEISGKQSEVLRNMKAGGASEDEIRTQSKVFNELKDNAKETADSLLKLNGASSKSESGFLDMAGKIASAMALISVVTKNFEAFVIAPITTEANIEATYKTAFDLTSAPMDQKKRMLAEQYDIDSRQRLSTQQTTAVTGGLATTIGAGIGAGIGVFVGGPAGAYVGMGLGSTVGGLAGGLTGGTITATSEAEIKLRDEELRKQFQLSEEDVARKRLSRSVLSGSMLGASKLMTLDSGFRGLFGYPHSDNENEDYSRKLNMDFELDTYASSMDRSTALVQKYMPYFTNQTRLRAFGGKEVDLAGYNREQALGYERSFMESAGGHSEEGLRHETDIARATGLDPRQLFQFNRSAQYFGTRDNSEFLSQGVAFTRQMYGNDSNAKIVEVLAAIRDINMDLLAVNKDAKQEQGFGWARIPELLFGKDNPFGQIDKLGKTTLSQIENLGKGGNRAQDAFLFRAYGENNPFTFEMRKLEGIFGEGNFKAIFEQLEKETGGISDKVKGYLMSLNLTSVPVIKAITELFDTGKIKIDTFKKYEESEYDENDKKHKGTPLHKKGDYILDGKGERIITGSYYETKDNFVNSLSGGVKGLEKYGLEDWAKAAKDSVAAAEAHGKKVMDIELETAKKYQTSVYGMIEDQSKLKSAFANSADAINKLAVMVAYNNESMQFQLYKMGIGNDPVMDNILKKHANDDGLKKVVSTSANIIEVARRVTEWDVKNVDRNSQTYITEYARILLGYIKDMFPKGIDITSIIKLDSPNNKATHKQIVNTQEEISKLGQQATR